MRSTKKIVDIRDMGEHRTGFIVQRNRRVIIMNEIRDFHDDGFVAFFGLSPSKVRVLKSNHVINTGVKLKRLRPRLPAVRISAKPIAEILESLRVSKAIALVEFKRKDKTELFLGTT